MMKINSKALLPLLILLLYSLVPGMDLQYEKSTRLSQDEAIVSYSGTFCVTRDGFFLVPDYKMGNVKIYKKDGELHSIFGKKGLGPNEFMSITASDFQNSKLALLDLRRHKVFIYSVNNKHELKYEKDFQVGIAFDLCMDGANIFIPGTKNFKGNEYALYSYNIGNDSYSFWLRAETQFGYKSYQQYRNSFEYEGMPISTYCFVDCSGDSIYSIWAGDLRIFKITAKGLLVRSFGKVTANYTKPVVSGKFKNAFRTKNIKVMQEEGRKLCYVSALFAGKDFVSVVYSRPNKKKEIFDFFVQFYKKDGTFINEIGPTSKFCPPLFFDKEKEIIYSMYRDKEDDIFIREYRLKR